jgi:signal transduction histidine kinase
MTAFRQGSASTASATYPLNEPLPPGMALGGQSILAFYKRYPVFSWPWIWRRFVLYSPLAIMPSLVIGLNYGASFHDPDVAIAMSWRLAGINLLALLGPPLLGLCARQLRAHILYRDAVVSIAVLAGIIGTIILLLQVDYFATAQLRLHPQASLPWSDYVVHQDRSWWGYISVFMYQMFLGGSFASRVYRDEASRWQKYLKKTELETARRQRDQADMELTVLQAQVEPHFLFNTLASVRSLIVADPKRAAETVDALAEHLRATLPKLRSQSASSTLSEQFAICESYLKVMRIRMGSRLRTTTALPHELKDIPFPPLMLISLVENAIKHGVEPKAGDVEVKLEAGMLNANNRRMLEVRVCDDGVGLSPGMGQGTGLSNIRAQLQHRFGESAVLQIESSGGAGLVASIRVPIELLTI